MPTKSEAQWLLHEEEPGTETVGTTSIDGKWRRSMTLLALAPLHPAGGQGRPTLRVLDNTYDYLEWQAAS